MRTPLRPLVTLIALTALLASAACRPPDERRSIDAMTGAAIAYSGYRDGQSPASGQRPSQAQVEEDLRILASHWQLIRVYSSDRHGEDVLEIIRREKIGLKVMLGIWLGREPGKEQDNATQIAEGIRLANEYQDVVVAVNVGNEILIEWTEHPVQEEQVIRYVREVRAAVTQPVTVADNYVWWRDYGAELADEVDFITIHTYPIWERKEIDEGLSYTVENYEGVRAAHPDVPIVIGEAGWATYTEGNLHVPRAGDEKKQQRYFDELSNWAHTNRVTTFYFEAFDEPWKSEGTEQHWGLFSVDRKAKPAIQSLYPDRIPSGPTSPAYPDKILASGPSLDVVMNSRLAEEISAGSVNPMGPGMSASSIQLLDGAEGGSGLSLTFTGDSWAGLYLFLNEYDAALATSLSMQLQLPAEVTQLELKLEGPETVARSVNLMQFQIGRDEVGWSRFRVPLAALEGIDLSRVAVIGLWNPSDENGTFIACSIVVDDIRFEAEAE